MRRPKLSHAGQPVTINTAPDALLIRKAVKLDAMAGDHSRTLRRIKAELARRGITLTWGAYEARALAGSWLEAAEEIAAQNQMIGLTFAGQVA